VRSSEKTCRSSNGNTSSPLNHNSISALFIANTASCWDVVNRLKTATDHDVLGFTGYSVDALTLFWES